MHLCTAGRQSRKHVQNAISTGGRWQYNPWWLRVHISRDCEGVSAILTGQLKQTDQLHRKERLVFAVLVGRDRRGSEERVSGSGQYTGEFARYNMIKTF